MVERAHFTETFTDGPYDCGGLVMVEDLVTLHINFLVNQRGSSPFPYFSETVRGTVVSTNLETGGTFTQVFTSNNRDHTIVDNGDGTITITVHSQGGLRAYDQFGNFVLADPGAFWFSFVVDYNDTPSDPSDDTEVEDSFQVVRESTGRNDLDGRDFCEDVVIFTTP